jgi:hypothetical protein
MAYERLDRVLELQDQGEEDGGDRDPHGDRHVAESLALRLMLPGDLPAITGRQIPGDACTPIWA